MRRSRWWIWWAWGVCLALVATSCAEAPVAYSASKPSTDAIADSPTLAAAQATLAQAQQAVLQARGGYYPRLDLAASAQRQRPPSSRFGITLSGSFGVESLSTATLFRASSKFWNLVADLTAPIFQGGALRAQKQAAIDVRWHTMPSWWARKKARWIHRSPRSACSDSATRPANRTCWR